jgi:hypothetical protein
MTGGAHTRFPLGAVALVVMAALAVPANAIAGPAIDEYTLDLPDTKGKTESPGVSPVANPAALPPSVVSRLSRNPSGEALATIATAESLGAPSAQGPINEGGDLNHAGGPSAVDGDQPSAPAAFGSAVSDPASIGVVALLLVIGGGVLLARRRTSRP